MVQGKGSARVVVKRQADALKAFLHHGMIAIHNFLGRDMLSVGADGYWDSVFVRSADKKDIRTFQPLITDIYVRRYVCSSQMSQVQWAVGIRQRRGHKNFFGQIH